MKLLKNMLTPPICAISVALLCATLFAEETITIDNVRQRTPWNGLVDIDYTIAGVTGDPNDYQIEFTMTVGSKSFVASNFWDAAWCDHATANGKQRATWNARADGIAEKTDVDVKARIIYAPVTDVDAEFAIVDLSSGSDSDCYPVRYVVGDTNRTAHFNINAYKLKKLVLKKVHAGEFWMGTGDVSSGKSRHRVRLTKDYWLGLFEVTRGQYWSVLPRDTMQVTTARYQYRPFTAADWDTVPISFVSWDGVRDSNGFLAKLNARARCRAQTVGLFSLPTEAQWEYACRAGTETKYFTGNSTNELAAYASMRFTWKFNIHGNFLPAEDPDANLLESETPYRNYMVGSFLPNPWGFYDVYGNVGEWVNDYYDGYPAYSETDVTEDPVGPELADNIISRGGCMWAGEDLCSSGYRLQNTKTGSNYNGYGNKYGSLFGFRLAGALK